MSRTATVDTRVVVETPEGVDFRFVIAGPGKRGVSFFLDTLIKLTVVVAVGMLVALITEIQDRNEVSGVGAGFFLIAWFCMSWLYGSCCEAFWNGQTPGKRAQHLRVVRTNGTPIGWFEAFGRNLLLPADAMLVLGPIAFNTVGLISMVATKRMQRLGDLIFDTMVIDETREYISRAPEVTQGVEPIRRSDCSGRFQVPERTLAVIERLYEGDRLISDGRREEIARPVAEALRERLGFTEPGPDQTNPNEYFAQSGNRHSTFLRRVLRTFADDGRESEDALNAERRSEGTDVSAGRLSAEPTVELMPDDAVSSVVDDLEVIDEPPEVVSVEARGE